MNRSLQWISVSSFRTVISHQCASGQSKCQVVPREFRVLSFNLIDKIAIFNNARKPFVKRYACWIFTYLDFSVLNFRPGPKLALKSNLWNVFWALQAIISGNFNWASLRNNVPKTVLKELSSSFFNFNFPIVHIYPRESQTSEYFQHYSGHFFGGI